MQGYPEQSSYKNARDTAKHYGIDLSANEVVGVLGEGGVIDQAGPEQHCRLSICNNFGWVWQKTESE